jgi:hypothetical protein
MPTISAPTKLLEHLLDETLAGRLRVHPHWATLARRNRVIPVYGDFMGLWVITMAGRLAFISDDEQDVVTPVSDDPSDIPGTHVALAQAAIMYKELASFMPPRPPNAAICNSCDGHGLVSPSHPNILCECGGAGWLPLNPPPSGI